MTSSNWCIVVTWSEPEEGSAVYGPYDHLPTHAELAAVSSHFRNTGAIPESTEFRSELMSPPPDPAEALDELKRQAVDMGCQAKENGWSEEPWYLDMEARLVRAIVALQEDL